MILDEIKASNVKAIKEKDQNARAVYSVVMTKAMLETVKKREKGEELQDVDMVQILQKTIKELQDEADNFQKAGKSEEESKILEQKEIISKFLPQMMSRDEIHSIISAMADKSVPSVMKHFKLNFPGKVDMSMVSQVLKEFQ